MNIKLLIFHDSIVKIPEILKRGKSWKKAIIWSYGIPLFLKYQGF